MIFQDNCSSVFLLLSKSQLLTAPVASNGCLFPRNEKFTENQRTETCGLPNNVLTGWSKRYLCSTLHMLLKANFVNSCRRLFIRNRGDADEVFT